MYVGVNTQLGQVCVPASMWDVSGHLGRCRLGSICALLWKAHGSGGRSPQPQTASCLTQIRRGVAVVGLPGGGQRLLELWGGSGKQQGAAGAGRPGAGGAGGGRAEGAFKAPAPPTGEQCRESPRCLPLAHSVAVLLELWSSLEPQQIPLTELTTRTPDQVMA